MSFQYHTRARERARKRFQCCRNQSLESGISDCPLIRFVCAECDSHWHDRCLHDKYGVKLRDAYANNNWKCPNCVNFNVGRRHSDNEYAYNRYSDENNDRKPHYKCNINDCDKVFRYELNLLNHKKERHNQNYIKLRHRKKSQKNQSRKDSDSSVHIISDYVSSDENTKKTDKKLAKKLKAKKKAIKNRLNNIDKRLGLKYNNKMLTVSDSATDDEFDAANYFPDKPPKNQKMLVQLRRKKASKNGVEYEPEKTASTWRTFEKAAAIKLLNSVGDNPAKWGYNAEYGWSMVDLSMKVRDYLYELRKKNPTKWRSVPFRNSASIKSKFTSWEDSSNKETNEKDWIGKYEAAKAKFKKMSKRASSNADKELEQFQTAYTEKQLNAAKKRIIKLEDKNELTETIKDTCVAVQGLVGVLKNETEDEKKQDDKMQCVINGTNDINNMHLNHMNDNYNVNHMNDMDDTNDTNMNDMNNVNEMNDFNDMHMNDNNEIYNPYLDKQLLSNCEPFSPVQNQQFMSAHSNSNDKNMTTPNNINMAARTQLNTERNEKGIDNVLKFITKMNNNKESAFDEENAHISENVSVCESVLFNDNKCYKLSRKFAALKNCDDLSDVNILSQLTATAKILLKFG